MFEIAVLVYLKVCKLALLSLPAAERGENAQSLEAVFLPLSFFECLPLNATTYPNIIRFPCVTHH